MARIAVIGAGAWGTALAIALARRGSHQLKLWAYEKEVVESIRATHVNEPFLSGCPLPESIYSHAESGRGHLGRGDRSQRHALASRPPRLEPDEAAAPSGDAAGLRHQGHRKRFPAAHDPGHHRCAHPRRRQLSAAPVRPQRTHLCPRGGQGLSHGPQRGLRRPRALRAGSGSSSATPTSAFTATRM